MSAPDHNTIYKAIKGATKPKEAPPKEKYLVAIRKYLAQDTSTQDALFANMSQHLLPKLNSPSLVVSLKAHIVFHHLIADPSIKKYAFLNFISRYYAAANRSSVDCTIGAGSSTMSMFVTNPPSLSPPSLISLPQSQDTDLTPPPKKSNLIHKLTHSHSSSFLSFTKSNVESDEAALDELAQGSKPHLLPNLAHSISQAAETNRLISSYNRYLRERVLHFRRLRIDPIREKVNCTSIVDTTDHNMENFSGTLLSQIQCVIQQIRLLLACIFPSNSLEHPLYAYCYGLVAKDISILFRFLNIAIVIALQNFFTLSRSNAERTLFAYKEYTQLQIPDEVLNFVKQAPNSVLDSDLDIPQALRQDHQSILALTKSLENYLYEISANEKAPQPVNAKKLSESETSDILSEHKSSSSISSISSNSSISHTNSPYAESKKSTTPLTATATRVPITRMQGHSIKNSHGYPAEPKTVQHSKPNPRPIPTAKRTNGSTDTIDRSFIRHTIHKSPFDPLFDTPPPAVPSTNGSNVTSRFFNDLSMSTSSSNQGSLAQVSQKNKSTPELRSNISMRDSEQVNSSSRPILYKSSTSSLTSVGTLGPEFSSKSTTTSSRSSPRPPTLPPPPLPEITDLMIDDSKVTAKDELPPNFDINDPSMENWKELFESLNNPEATFSLKFDMAAALQRSIKLYEVQQNQLALNQQNMPPIQETNHKPAKSSKSNSVSSNHEPQKASQPTKQASRLTAQKVPVVTDHNMNSFTSNQKKKKKKSTTNLRNDLPLPPPPLNSQQYSLTPSVSVDSYYSIHAPSTSSETQHLNNSSSGIATSAQYQQLQTDNQFRVDNPYSSNKNYGNMQLHDETNYNPYTAPPPPTMHEQYIRERYTNAYNDEDYNDGHGDYHDLGNKVIKQKASGIMKKALRKVSI